jgi:hypothetical protein
MSPTRPDLTSEYAAYQGRFDQLGGKGAAIGAPAKWKGRLVKKLSLDQFEGRLAEFHKLDVAYAEILERGDTINDAVIKLLRDRAAELLLDREY